LPRLSPFSAFRPEPSLANSVSASATDFASEAEMILDLKANPDSYLYVTKSHLILADVTNDPKSMFPFAANFINRLKEEGKLVQDQNDSYYIYRQTLNGESHTGIVGLCDMIDYQEDRIKKHELTKPEREYFISNLIKTTNTIGEPLLMSHTHKQSLEDLLRIMIIPDPDLSFDSHNCHHQIWAINEPENLEKIAFEMESISDYYIMDGHHRAASANNIYQSDPSEKNRYVLSLVLDANQLKIKPFHRFIEGCSLPHEQLMEKLALNFEITETKDYVLHPEQQGDFVLKCCRGDFYLTTKKEMKGLDVSILENLVIKPIFQIQDSRSDERIQFISDNEELQLALTKLESPDNFLFLLHPCRFEDISHASDNKLVMPAKSTYVEPKCRSGLFLQEYGL
jgi:uncharacterized protein (DUF1015 family)